MADPGPAKPTNRRVAPDLHDQRGGVGRVYSWVFDRLLTRVDAERAHTVSFGTLRAIAGVPGGVRLIRRVCRPGSAPVHALGLEFPSPLGLAAGFDKDATGPDALGALGFGFVEVGTVTAQPQAGNPRPRLFRLPRDRAIVNRMGFNNEGAAAVAVRLRRRRKRSQLVVGVNIGKTKVVDDSQAVADYTTSAALLAPYADYLVVNVSSPNTPGLRDLQAVDRLRPLLTAVRDAADTAAGRHVPLLVKIAPDLADADIEAVADLAVEIGLDGIVATNTTVSRHGLTSDPGRVESVGTGGLSGAPLHSRSIEVLGLLRARVDDALTIISVGGISSAADARERLAAGATLVQAYTGFIYGGPLWPGRVTRALAAGQNGGTA